jgi:hypothetical protein
MVDSRYLVMAASDLDHPNPQVIETAQEDVTARKTDTFTFTAARLGLRPAALRSSSRGASRIGTLSLLKTLSI